MRVTYQLKDKERVFFLSDVSTIAIVDYEDTQFIRVFSAEGMKDIQINLIDCFFVDP